MISIELYGNPIPQKRPKFARRGQHVHVYSDQDKLKQGYHWQLASQYKEEPMAMPLAVDVVFFMPIPKSTSALKKRQMTNGVIGHSKKPDLDNLIKFLFDCLNQKVFKDDAQIADLRAKKIYSSTPRTLIRIIPLADEKRELLYENCTRNI